jgi:hypothetical protein
MKKLELLLMGFDPATFGRLTDHTAKSQENVRALRYIIFYPVTYNWFAGVMQ